MLEMVDNAQRITRDDFGKLTAVHAAQAIPPPDRVWSDADWHPNGNQPQRGNSGCSSGWGHRINMWSGWLPVEPGKPGFGRADQ